LDQDHLLTAIAEFRMKHCAALRGFFEQVLHLRAIWARREWGAGALHQQSQSERLDAQGDE